MNQSNSEATANPQYSITSDPRPEYETRLAARRALLKQIWQRYRRVGAVRIAVFAVALAMFVLSLQHRLGLQWLLLPGVLSLVLLVIHHNIYKAMRRCHRAINFYLAGLERLDWLWQGKGRDGIAYQLPEHPYAADIDLFGRGSLYELLCAARTSAGEETLAAWLQAPASVTAIRARQQAVRDLQARLDLREDLSLIGEEIISDSTEKLNTTALIRWGAAPPVFPSRAPQTIARLITASVIVALLLWFAGYGLLPLYGSLFAVAILWYALRHQVGEVVTSVQAAGRGLAVLAEVLRRFEQEPFTAPRLIELQTSLKAGAQTPSQQIAQLHSLINRLDARLNQFFLPFAILLSWTEHCAFAVESWRQQSGPLVKQWVEAIGELEALCSIAAYAYEHPRDPFPELIETGRCFEATAVGHPLLPADRCVRTNLTLNDDLRMLVVSGSNMSGKSTLLRTVGINTVLALAGAPVRAERLCLSPLALGASIHIQDNLQTGASLFYAEITRLRQLMEMTREPLPLLFIIDEILHGTNSHDRRIGAEAILKGLVARGAIGLVTTHDLALTNVVTDLQPRAANVHFQDHLEDGQMKFDYILREGVVTKSNAIELMRSVGLEV